ncbi:MAG: cytoplasmic protein [Proteobacteria bacterium]|nr:cytoplasmic protein [Pseudomonadota bacterium]MBU1451371.1 cytoplasmic protein [Pseudomonadota bacterium]MBU2467602.1 cytoplasmic protein [Pseudomonadota bacterium]MBU2517110.1 cytoplasmic protein [Pseudomonadota bacterium]
MATHSHDFVEQYTGLVGFGMDRPTDEATVLVYLQKFSDDGCMATILPRLSPEELSMIFDTISGLLRRHLKEEEYHAKFLKDPEPHHHAPMEE